MTNNIPLISIIIPVYNAEKYINRAIKSLINQTYKNIEILCIDDGSKDNSYNIIKEFQDKRLKLFKQENSGCAYARNVGLENSKGEYIMFCDADDYYEPNMCENMLYTIIDQNVDFVMCGCNIVNTYNSHIRQSSEFGFYELKLKGYCYIGIYEFLILNTMVWNKIFKKSIIDEYGIQFINCYEFDDYNFFYKYLSCSNNFYALDKKLYNYDVSNPQSIMSLYFTKKLKDEKKLDFLYSGHDLIDFVIEHNFREQVVDGIMEMYKETVLSSCLFLNKKQLKELVMIQKEFFRGRKEFDKYKYIEEIKNTEVSKYIKRFDIKLSLLEWIFSLKNKSMYEKILTIFGIKISLKRYKN